MKLIQVYEKFQRLKKGVGIFNKKIPRTDEQLSASKALK
jgi:hypothetical protein